MSQKIIKETTAGAILAIEMEINLLDNDMEVLERDMEYLNTYLNNLVYNRIFLKKEKVVTSMFEYKRTMSEFSQVQRKMSELRGALNKVSRKMELKLQALEHYHTLLEMEEIIEAKKVLLFTGKSR